jgi:hypothetical protein
MLASGIEALRLSDTCVFQIPQGWMRCLIIRSFKIIRLLALEQHQQSNHPNKQQGVKDVLVTH